MFELSQKNEEEALDEAFYWDCLEIVTLILGRRDTSIVMAWRSLHILSIQNHGE
jgi:hypothetical protein